MILMIIHFFLVVKNSNQSEGRLNKYLQRIPEWAHQWKMSLEEILNGQLISSRRITLIQNLQNKFPRNALLTIYKSFIRPHLDYDGVVMINQTMNLLVENWKKSNTMLHWQLMVLLRRALHEKSFIRN